MTIGEIGRRILFLFRRNRFERDLQEELQLHAELRSEKLRASGVPAEHADTAAERRLGGKTRVMENSRGVWTFTWLESIFQDVRYAARILVKNSTYAGTAIVTLGLGLGLNTALFTLFNANVLRPFAVQDPYSLYQVNWATKDARRGISWEQFQAVRAHKAVFSDAFASINSMIRVEDRRLRGTLVSGNYFSLLGVDTALGRPLLPEDAAVPGSQPVLVLTYSAWMNYYSGDSGSAPGL